MAMLKNKHLQQHNAPQHKLLHLVRNPIDFVRIYTDIWTIAKEQYNGYEKIYISSTTIQPLKDRLTTEISILWNNTDHSIVFQSVFHSALEGLGCILYVIFFGTKLATVHIRWFIRNVIGFVAVKDGINDSFIRVMDAISEHSLNIADSFCETFLYW